MHGVWPGIIDHEDHDGLNNRLLNLINGDHAQNMKNMKLHKTNKSGVSGVSWSKAAQKWRAEIWHKNEHKFVGQFSEFDDAVKARKQAEVEHGYHENHGKG